MIILRNFLNRFFSFFFPPRCPACDGILELSERGNAFCGKCMKKIRGITDRVCLRCGRTLALDEEEFCPDCKKAPHLFSQAKAVYEYSGPMREAMYRFKYSNRRDYAGGFAKSAKSRYASWFRGTNPALIVPVPMYRDKERARGYNQAEVFARDLSREISIPLCSDLVVRTRNTKPLKTLSPDERRANLKSAFKITKVFRKSADILLVDDIFTTGATADEVSGVLKDAGAGKIYCLFICTGRGDVLEE